MCDYIFVRGRTVTGPILLECVLPLPAGMETNPLHRPMDSGAQSSTDQTLL